MRFISMKHFRSLEAEKVVSFDRKTLVLGQILGQVTSVKTKQLTNPLTGEIKQSLVLIGDFSGISYEARSKAIANNEPGESAELNSHQLYMPAWFSETVAERLDKQPGGKLDFAAEIVMLPTPEGSTIKYQYDVRSLVARPASSPVEALKRALQKTGQLRLSAPQDEEAVKIVISKPGTLPQFVSGSEADERGVEDKILDDEEAAEAAEADSMVAPSPETVETAAPKSKGKRAA
jgi:hypothetical protein